jgi:hypothetical protein
VSEPAPRPDTTDMRAVHNVFRSSLASTPAFVASTTGNDERRALMVNYYANLVAFLEAHHDGEEDLVFPLLMERAPESRELIEQIAGQHAEVVGLMGAVRDNLISWEATGDVAASEVLQAFQSLDEILSPHLDQEEADILPMAADYLTVEEWGALPGHAMSRFGGDKIWLILGLIRENFTDEQRAMMMDQMPPPARRMWETMGETSFNDLMAHVRQ